jgi:3-hydroxybutyryl-CoA dehydratase
MNEKSGSEGGGIAFEDIRVGMSARYSHTITDADIRTYAQLSGDFNPVHFSEEYAVSSRFKGRIAHGLYSAGFFSALFGTQLPGPGCVYVSQNLNFKLPVYLGDTVTAEIKVTAIDDKKRRVFFDTTCSVKDAIVIEGKAELYVRKRPLRAPVQGDVK